MAVLPFGRSGTIAAAMLGLGRALGETVAVLIILRTASAAPSGSPLRRRLHVRLEDRLRRRRVQRAHSRPVPISPPGFVLFVLTFIVNAIARAIAGRKVNG